MRITLKNENSFGFLLYLCMCSFFLVIQYLDLLIIFLVQNKYILVSATSPGCELII